MNTFLVHQVQRNSLRRAVSTPCWAVSLENGRVLGEQILDLSADGVLVGCRAKAKVGEKVFIVFKAPGPDELWLRADARISRIVRGWRRYDPGRCVGLRLTDFDPESRCELRQRLIGYPPPIPRRSARLDYAETVRRIAYAA